MGVLRSLEGTSLIYLKPVHVFGRDPNVADHILSTHICSRMHCVIRWQNGSWFLIDESRNGCYINGQRIEKSRAIGLNKNDTIAITSKGDARWTFTDNGIPKPALVSLDTQDFIELQNLNILPDENQPECQILKQDQLWTFEKEHDSHTLSEGSQVIINNQKWAFYPNYLLDETEFREPRNRQTATLIFNVSRSEEHVQLILKNEHLTLDLGQKAYHYLLLEMARHSLNDLTDSEQERGWMSNDLLLNILKIDINHLNIQIYRARKSIRKYSDFWSQNLIGRRRGEIRLYPCDIVINKV